MWSLAVVDVDEPPEACLGMRNRLVGLELHLVVLDGSPETLDEDVVTPAAFAVHADPNAIRLELPGEFGAGELAALVGVEDFPVRRRPRHIRMYVMSLAHT